ncbi:MAG: M50 family metallopeptidase [Firmicutes bacterium]|nr:M50 family metallopeptidase [Bacillota bacterium]
MTKKAKLLCIAVAAVFIAAVLFLCVLLHELGHALAIWISGGRIENFSLAFFNAYVTTSTEFTPAAYAWIIISGTLLPLCIFIAVMLFYRPNKKFTKPRTKLFYNFAFIIFAVFFISQILPWMFLIGPVTHDPVMLIDSLKIHPLSVAFTALAVFVGLIALLTVKKLPQRFMQALRENMPLQPENPPAQLEQTPNPEQPPAQFEQPPQPENPPAQPQSTPNPQPQNLPKPATPKKRLLSRLIAAIAASVLTLTGIFSCIAYTYRPAFSYSWKDITQNSSFVGGEYGYGSGGFFYPIKKADTYSVQINMTTGDFVTVIVVGVNSTPRYAVVTAKNKINLKLNVYAIEKDSISIHLYFLHNLYAFEHNFDFYISYYENILITPTSKRYFESLKTVYKPTGGSMRAKFTLRIR